MNKRVLTMLISAALLGAAGTAVAQSGDTYERGAPPPVSDATMPPPVDPMLDDADDMHMAAPQVRTQSPPNDPTLASRLNADADVDMRSEARVVIDDDDDRALADAEFDGELDADADSMDGDDAVRSSAAVSQDPTDHAEQPLAGNELDAGGEASTVTESEGTPFADTAGSEGFSEGQTASHAAKRFSELDSDGDGELDTAELGNDSALADRQKEYDINGDGLIARNEFQSWFAAQNWLEGDNARDSGLANIDNDEVAEVEVDADSDLDADIDADIDNDLDNDD